MDLRAFVEWLRYQAGGPQAAPVGKPAASIEVLTARGKRTLTPTKRTRAVDAAGPATGGAISDDRTV